MSEPECRCCRLEWPVVMINGGVYHAVPLHKSRVGRRWLAAGLRPALIEMQECTRPRDPAPDREPSRPKLTVLRGGLP
jgi:hypothetical protein